MANILGDFFRNNLTGTNADDIIEGLGGNDTITGDSGNDIINGGSDNDSLDGGAGNDTIFGGSGNDTLDAGSSEFDLLFGGSGNDLYLVTNGFSDDVFESSSGGDDTVESAVAYTLSDNVENLTLTAIAAPNLNFSGTGNSLDNRITGNLGNNVLRGRTGNDTLTGNGGNDILVGGAGADELKDGGGQDVFRYYDVSESTPTSRDTIDLDPGFDIIDLSEIDPDPNDPGDQQFDFIGSAPFNSAGSGQVRFDAANNLIQAEIQGDGNITVDLEIQSSVNFTTLSASDFIL